MRKTNLARLLARQPDWIFVAPFEQGEIGPDLFRAGFCSNVSAASKETRPVRLEISRLSV